MPDANNNFKGQGWSAKREAGWLRAFGPRSEIAKFCDDRGTMTQPASTKESSA